MKKVKRAENISTVGANRLSVDYTFIRREGKNLLDRNEKAISGVKIFQLLRVLTLTILGEANIAVIVHLIPA